MKLIHYKEANLEKIESTGNPFNDFQNSLEESLKLYIDNVMFNLSFIVELIIKDKEMSLSQEILLSQEIKDIFKSIPRKTIFILEKDLHNDFILEDTDHTVLKVKYWMREIGKAVDIKEKTTTYFWEKGYYRKHSGF